MSITWPHIIEDNFLSYERFVSNFINLVFTGKLYKFPIHEDSANKLLSVVVYLYPKLNTGTILYSDQSGNDKTIIEWVPNRALIFSREEGVTWHSYEGNGISTRYALVANLRSDT